MTSSFSINSLILTLLYLLACVSALPSTEDNVSATDAELVARQAAPQWAHYFGVDSATHQRNFNTYARDGYRMVSLSAYGVPPSVLYAAVWVKKNGPQWLAIHDASASTYQNWVVSNKNAGYASTIVTVTGPSGSPVYAGVMEKIDIAWEQKCNLLPNEFQEFVSESYNSKMIIKGFRDYGAMGNAADRRYCALRHANPGNDQWTYWYGQDYAAYQNSFNAETQKRFWRPAYVTISEHHLVTAMFTDRSVGSGGWYSKHGITGTQLESEIQTRKSQGYYPISIQGGGPGQGPYTQYAVIFAKQDQWSDRNWAATGGNGLASPPVVNTFDVLMKTFMQRNGVRHGQLSVGRAGTVQLRRGYTWAEPDRATTTPEDRFLLASVSKMFVAATITRLYATNKLQPDTLVYANLGYNAPADARAKNITVQHLVEHRGGYDRTITSDPVFRFREIANARGGSQPASMKDVVDFQVKQRLDFEPGAREIYSNYGYLLLSYLVEKVSGVPYFTFLQREVLAGLDVGTYATAGSAHVNDRIVQESPWVSPSAANPMSNALVPNVYGGDGLYKESCQGPSSLTASASTVVRFIATHAVRWTGGRRVWDHDGAMDGSRTWAQSRTDGLDWSVTFNTRSFDDANFMNLVKGLNQYMDSRPFG